MKRVVGSLGIVVGVAAAFLVIIASCGPDGGGIAKSFDLAGTDIVDPNEPDLWGENIFPDFGDTDGDLTHDPATCAEAAMAKSYIGCDYWPTVTANAVWNVFDYAVVVSNPGQAMANITVTGGALASDVMQQVAPGALVKIGLPWIPALKGPEANAQGGSSPMTNSVKAMKAAYHLTSDVPVLVYQFNALEYKAESSGNDLQGIAWSTCPPTMAMNGVACLSYSNDASLLLPSTAMTPNYVVTGISGDDAKPSKNGTPGPLGSSFVTITATVDATTITIQLSKTADILASSDATIAAVPQNMSTPAKIMYTLNAGDVLELLGGKGSSHDFTGSIIEATQPIQVIVGMPCTTNPTNYPTAFGGAYSCDHIEETVLPIETWGKVYGVTAPTGPDGMPQSHTVRIYGGTADATLTFAPAVTGAPATIGAGQVVRFDTTTDFVVSGDKEFAISSQQMSAEVVSQLPGDAANPKGDPSLSFFSAMAQYRDKYLFLAPSDYDNNFVDIVIPDATNLMLDGATVTASQKPIGGGFSSVRVPLQPGTSNGAHLLTGDKPFGIQVVGYGAQTSYQYPGGLDLKVIAPPPPIL